MEVKVSICREKCSRLTDLAECCYGNSKADVESENSSEAAVSRSLRPLPLPAALGAISPAAGSLCKYLEAVQTVIRILVMCRMWKANILVHLECLKRTSFSYHGLSFCRLCPIDHSEGGVVL